MPDDAKWCIDNINHLTPESFFDQYHYTDKAKACRRYKDILTKWVIDNENYVASYSDRKYADALGKNAVTDNEEFFIESSSGFEKENVSHSLDDTLKLLAECSSALLHIIKHNKKAGIDTIIKKCTLDVQVIKKKLDTDKGDPIKDWQVETY